MLISYGLWLVFPILLLLSLFILWLLTLTNDLDRWTWPRYGYQAKYLGRRKEYKLLSLTYKVLITTQPPYLHNLISVQRPHSTRSSSVSSYRIFCLKVTVWINAQITQPPQTSVMHVVHKVTDNITLYSPHHFWKWRHLSQDSPEPSISLEVCFAGRHSYNSRVRKCYETNQSRRLWCSWRHLAYNNNIIIIWNSL